MTEHKQNALPVVGWLVRIAGADALYPDAQSACYVADQCSRNGAKASAFPVVDYDVAAEALAQRDVELAELRGLLEQGDQLHKLAVQQIQAKDAELTNLRARLAELESQKPVAFVQQASYSDAGGDGHNFHISERLPEFMRLYAAPVPAPSQVADGVVQLGVTAREVILEAIKWLEVHSSVPGDSESYAAGDLRALLAASQEQA